MYAHDDYSTYIQRISYEQIQEFYIRGSCTWFPRMKNDVQTSPCSYRNEIHFHSCKDFFGRRSHEYQLSITLYHVTSMVVLHPVRKLFLVVKTQRLLRSIVNFTNSKCTRKYPCISCDKLNSFT